MLDKQRIICDKIKSMKKIILKTLFLSPKEQNGMEIAILQE